MLSSTDGGSQSNRVLSVMLNTSAALAVLSISLVLESSASVTSYLDCSSLCSCCSCALLSLMSSSWLTAEEWCARAAATSRSSLASRSMTCLIRRSMVQGEEEQVLVVGASWVV
jgi:hypothetical protein